MEKGVNREKISPGRAASKTGKPNWRSVEDSRHYWRKTFYINGVLSGKRVKKKRRKFSRESFKFYLDFLF